MLCLPRTRLTITAEVIMRKQPLPSLPTFITKSLNAKHLLLGIFLLLAACSGKGDTETVTPSIVETPEGTPLQLPSETPLAVTPHPQGWELYINQVYGYQLYHPPSATVTFTGAQGVRAEEVPDGVSPEEYLVQLQNLLSEQLCVLLEYELGYIQISAPTNAGFRYAICGLTGVGVGEMTDKSEDIEIGGSTYRFNGFEFLGDEETPEVHFEIFSYEMEDGTRIEIGSIPGPTGTYEEYLATTKETLLQILATLDFSISGTFDWGNYVAPPEVTPSSAGDVLLFVEDVTIPDGTIFEPEEPFTKTWRLQNAGENTWTQGYALRFHEGDQMGGPFEILLQQTIDPNQTVDLSVELIAPEEPGLYTGYWIMRNADGLTFGTGPDKDQPFFVMIEVRIPGEPTPTAGSVSNGSTVTGASLSASPSSHSGECPATISFTGTIKSSGAGSFIYQLEAGASTSGFTFSLPPAQTATYTSEGGHQLNVSYTLEIEDSVSAWARLYISSPNTYRSDEVQFTVNCD
jgi:hypothetical protein